MWAPQTSFPRATLRPTSGFTLIELLVVMAIISILAAIGLSYYGGLQSKGRDVTRKNDLVQMSRALELYFNDHNQYPASDAQGRMVACGAGASPVACDWGVPFVDKNNTNYMGILPTDPVPAQQYFYVSTLTGYQVYARIENLQDRDIILNGGNPQVYGNLNCGADNCNYRRMSANSPTSTGPALVDD